MSKLKGKAKQRRRQHTAPARARARRQLTTQQEADRQAWAAREAAEDAAAHAAWLAWLGTLCLACALYHSKNDVLGVAERLMDDRWCWAPDEEDADEEAQHNALYDLCLAEAEATVQARLRSAVSNRPATCEACGERLWCLQQATRKVQSANV